MLQWSIFQAYVCLPNFEKFVLLELVQLIQQLSFQLRGRSIALDI